MKLTHAQIKLLDKLCARWEERVSEANLKLLIHFYKSEHRVHELYTDLRAIDFETLKADFVGRGKKFETPWKLMIEIGQMLREIDYPEVRLRLSPEAIAIIHMSGLEKHIVLSIIRKGKKWTYKGYLTLEAYVNEMAGRGLGTPIPYTKFFAKKPERPAKKGGWVLPAFSKEEYGGIDLRALYKTANEKDNVHDILQEPIFSAGAIGHLTYNPKTKKIYRIDVA